MEEFNLTRDMSKKKPKANILCIECIDKGDNGNSYYSGDSWPTVYHIDGYCSISGNHYTHTLAVGFSNSS